MLAAAMGMMMAALGSPPATDASLCIDGHRGKALAQRLDQPALLDAIAQRLGFSFARVMACADAASAEEITWRVHLEPSVGESTERWVVSIVGPGIAWSRHIVPPQQSPAELARWLAITIVEVVRPSVTTSLPSAADALLETVPDPPAPQPQRPTKVEVAPPPHSWLVSVGSSFRFGVLPADLGHHLSLGCRYRHENLLAGFDLGWHRPGSLENTTGVPLTFDNLETGVGIGYQLSQIELEVGARLRATWVGGGSTPRQRNPFVVWGLRLGAAWWLWESDRFAVGAHVGGWWWPQANRFLIRGAHAYSQPLLELAIGVSLRFGVG